MSVISRECKLRRMRRCPSHGPVWRERTRECRRFVALVLAITVLSLAPLNGRAQQPTAATPAPAAPLPQFFGGQGFLFLSQFANPAVIGALYLTPNLPRTGYYPVYPTPLAPIIDKPGIVTGPLVLHPSMGVAEMFTDNVFRTNGNRRSDFIQVLSPGIQAQLPFAKRHLFMIDYRTNIQYYSRTPSNDVQDQTASGRLQFNLPWGLNLDFQGEHKLGHDPRGTAVDLLALEVNKWTTNGFTGQASYQGGRVGAILTTQVLRWNFLNNDQAIFRDRLTNYAGLTLLGGVSPKTSLLASFSVLENIYDQNKNLDSTIYTVSTGARWDLTGKTTGELLVGYQSLRFNQAPVQQQGVLSAFNRQAGTDSAGGLFFSGTLSWTPTARLRLSVQPYRTIQQTVFINTLFFTATGVNVSAVHALTERLDVTANLGYEQDRFSTPSGSTSSGRRDTLKNAAVGVRYRAVKWLGVALQYVFEQRDSNVDEFNYNANTVILSAQLLL